MTEESTKGPGSIELARESYSVLASLLQDPEMASCVCLHLLIGFIHIYIYHFNALKSLDYLVKALGFRKGEE